MNHRPADIGAGVCAAAAGAAAVLWVVLRLLPTPLTLSSAGSAALYAAACLGTYLAGRLRARHLKTPEAEAVMIRCFLWLFCLYLLLLFYYTLFSRQNMLARSGTGWEGLRSRTESMTNFVPLRTVRRYLRSGVSRSASVVNLAGNAAAFAPFALFLPLLWERMRKFGVFALSVFLAVLGVECAQLLLGVGFFDVDDFILNLGGACLLYGLLHWRPVRNIVNRVTVTPY